MSALAVSRLSRIAWCAYFLAWAVPVCGQTVWLEGRALDRQLLQPIQAQWQGQPLRRAMQGLSRRTKVAAFLDRRIDPDAVLNLTIDADTTIQGWQHIAGDRDAAVVVYGPLLYLAPLEIADRILAVLSARQQELERLPVARRRALQRSSASGWQDLATPRELVSEMAREANLRVENLDAIPHDLWVSVSLPPMTWVERFSLVLANFDLTYEWTRPGRTISLQPFPAQPLLTRCYVVSPSAKRGINARWKSGPDTRMEFQGSSRLMVTADKETHSRLQEFIDRSQVRGSSPPRGRRQYQITVADEDRPVGAVIESLARQLQLKVRWNERAIRAEGLSKEALTSFKVEKASMEELFHAVLDPVGLKHRRSGDTLHIEPK